MPPVPERRARIVTRPCPTRWTSETKLGYNVLKCDQIVVPVHQVRTPCCWCMLARKVRREASPQEMHWVLAVIDVKKQEVCYMDSLGGVDRMCQARAALCRLGRGCAACMATASI